MKYLSTDRRAVLKGILAAAGAGLLPSIGSAQKAYPAKPIKLISPWSAGGTSDVVLRAFAASAAKNLDATIYVDNKPGAGGVLGAAELANARPDGYVLSQLAMSILSVPHMHKLNFDPLRDITYIARLCTYTNGLVVRADSPIKSIADLMEYAKANPEKFSYASSGVGSSPHLLMEELGFRGGVKFLHVPYKADSESLQAMMGGTVMGMSGSTSWAPQVAAGNVRILATYGAKRTKHWPAVPTLPELGYNVPETPFGVGGPKGMDPAVVIRLQDAFRQSLNDAEVIATLDRNDMQPAFLSSTDYTKSCAEIFESQKLMINRLGLGLKV
jgi:tripartite-type tricarboxylate transporter receptor subunit TctC